MHKPAARPGRCTGCAMHCCRHTTGKQRRQVDAQRTPSTTMRGRSDGCSRMQARSGGSYTTDPASARSCDAPCPGRAHFDKPAAQFRGWTPIAATAGRRRWHVGRVHPHMVRRRNATAACNLRVRQASMGPRSARDTPLGLSTHRRPKRSLAKCAGSGRAWHRDVGEHGQTPRAVNHVEQWFLRLQRRRDHLLAIRPARVQPRRWARTPAG
jgi:hypothetical protein